MHNTVFPLTGAWGSHLGLVPSRVRTGAVGWFAGFALIVQLLGSGLFVGAGTASASTTAGGCFASPALYPLQNDPRELEVADFNADGKLDLAVMNSGSNNVSILLGNGDGTFSTPAPTYPVGSSPSGLTMGDFDGNGTWDLVTGNQRENNVSVLLGNGDGTFQSHVTYPTGGSFSYGITTGDLNGDSRLDLAVANYNTRNVSVLLGNGSGGFASAIVTSTGAWPSQPSGIKMGDFNADGKLDLAVTIPDMSTLAVMLGNGNGTFQPMVTYSVGYYGHGIAVADLDGNGTLDLGLANAGSNNVSVLLGNGDGTFQPHVSYPVGSFPVGIAARDLDSNGTLDLAVANYTSRDVSVLLGNGNGTFRPRVNFPAGGPPSGLAVGNFNADGRLDLATANPNLPPNGNTVSVLLSTPCASSVDLTSAPNPSVVGQQVTFTATVSAANPANGTPSGTVTFKEGEAKLSIQQLDANGVATFSTSSLSVGQHTISAEYSGNGSFLASSDTHTHVVVAPTNTPTSTSTSTATSTRTSTSTATATSTSTPTSTNTAVPTSTNTVVPTGTSTAVPTGTNTAVPTGTNTAVPTSTNTAVPTSTNTAVPTGTSTPSATATYTRHFVDVPPSDPFFEGITRLYQQGVISGYGDGTYRPYNPVTRAQIAKLVAISAGFDEPPGPQVFSDVPATDPFYPYINRLANRSIVAGYPCPQLLSPSCTPENPLLFRPGANATRGQLAKIVALAAGFSEPVSGQHYADVPPTGEGSQFYEWIMRLTRIGVIDGYSCGPVDMPCDALNRPYFRPAADVTRGQAAKIVANTFFP